MYAEIIDHHVYAHVYTTASTGYYLLKTTHVHFLYTAIYIFYIQILYYTKYKLIVLVCPSSKRTALALTNIIDSHTQS